MAFYSNSNCDGIGNGNSHCKYQYQGNNNSNSNPVDRMLHLYDDICGKQRFLGPDPI